MITTERGPITLTIDGQTWTTEREVTRVDDWRDTPWGKVNFGYVRWGPQRMAPCPKPADKVD